MCSKLQVKPNRYIGSKYFILYNALFQLRFIFYAARNKGKVFSIRIQLFSKRQFFLESFGYHLSSAAKCVYVFVSRNTTMPQQKFPHVSSLRIIYPLTSLSLFLSLSRLALLHSLPILFYILPTLQGLKFICCSSAVLRLSNNTPTFNFIKLIVIRRCRPNFISYIVLFQMIDG